AGRKHVERGTVVVTTPGVTPYRAVLHAVAVNAFYESSPAIVGDVVRACLHAAAEHGAQTVALTALATGYGKLTIGQFAEGLSGVIDEDFSPIRGVTIVVRGVDDAEEINRVSPTIAVAAPHVTAE
ncbi:MAG: Appr-p processing protein, partial [Phycisphaerales bacterium]|nr:Appr-p processing protein [Phycisphaerales bacterium]